MKYRLDMTTMLPTIHDAFPRDLVEIARVADHQGSPLFLQSQRGWELFKKVSCRCTTRPKTTLCGLSCAPT